jgi:hypothetical protein
MDPPQPAVDKFFFAFLPHNVQRSRSDPTVVGLDSASANPGFLTATGVQRDSSLQGILDRRLQSLDLAKRTRLENLRFALVDLTQSIDAPKFAGHSELKQGGLGSMAKLAIMNAAYQLKFDLSIMAVRRGLTTKEDLFKAARDDWNKTQIRSTSPTVKELHASKPKIELHDKLVKVEGEPFPLPLPSRASMPDLERIFDKFTVSAGVRLTFQGGDRILVDDPARVLGIPHTTPACEKYAHHDEVTESEDLTECRKLTFAERLFLTVDLSANAGAHTCVENIGFCYIASPLWQSDIYSPNRGGGLWEGASHGAIVGDTLQWKWKTGAPPVPRGADLQSCTAASIAALLTLMVQGRLVDAESSAAMLHLMSKRKQGLTNAAGQSIPSYTRSGFQTGLRSLPDGKRRFRLTEFHSKLGIGDHENDCALVVRRETRQESSGTVEKDLRYIATGFDSGGAAALGELIVELDMAIQENNGFVPRDRDPALAAP